MLENGALYVLSIIVMMMIICLGIMSSIELKGIILFFVQTS